MAEFRIWERYGWKEVQLHASSCWQRPVSMTCKKATVVDMIWMSPEATALCINVGCVDLFADHVTLFADFFVPEHEIAIRTWPQPTAIPWDQIDMDKWHNHLAASSLPDLETTSDTAFFTAWAQHWESALDGCVKNQPDARLPSNYRGRAVRTKPMMASPSPPVLRASRDGEVRLRSDLVSTRVQQWFRQLRRLQSYKHAALANKLTLDAETYRLELWAAIKRSRGFDGLFEAWWPNRNHHSPAAPCRLPSAPPDGRTAEIIFCDFKLNFEAFERWHLRQRKKLLQAKYDHSCRRLFQELRAPQREQLDMLWHTQDLTILAVDFDGLQIHVDQPVLGLMGCVWFVNHIQLDVNQIDGEVLLVRQLPPHIEPGDLLQCFRYYADVDQVHQAMVDLWQPRWQQASVVGTEQWERIIGFIQAYMPKMDFPACSLELPNWRLALTQFPKHPARGVDGIDVADLQHLPDPSSQRLLDFLRTIDGVTHSWPRQLLYGTVISLSKQDSAHLPAHFRPVVILGTVYRTWSRMCAMPLLQILGQVVPASAHGFLPGRECAQVWLQLPGFIEVCLQQGIELSGFSTDIEKCFNNVGRDPLMALAEHLGFDQQLLKPWRSFLDTFVRSFKVRTALSVAIESSQGLPEGCSLSVVGMVLIDWAFHVYLSALCPSVHAFSYVDNVSEAGHQTMEVVSAFFSTLCFFHLWGLTLDHGKTYFWSTTTHARALLRLLGLSLRSDALELGGSMCFDAQRRNRLLKARGDRLLPKWDRLRRSLSPLAQKYMVLPLAFWPMALDGAAACPLADNYFHQLRQAANKALRCKQAGANALLRFSLSDNMLADPGFYHLISVVQTFRRVCGRSPRILDCWRLWMADFSGHVTLGPFGVFMDTLNKVGWSVGNPPLIADSAGNEFDLLLTPWPLFRHLLEDAWLRQLASTLQRPSMAGLTGIDVYVTKWRNGSLTSLERALQSALQSGAFLDEWTQGKFDVTKQRFCNQCLCPQTHAHLLVCPKYADLRDFFSLTNELELVPPAFSQHLLCPRSPWIDALRSYFLQLPDTTDVFSTGPADAATQHVFTDGSHTHDGRYDTKRAAWGLYNSNTKLPIASGWLSGLPQTIARAELTAVIAALKWAIWWQAEVHIWLDALEIHRGLQRRLGGHTTQSFEANGDLWLSVDMLLAQGARTLVNSTWVPSHLDTSLCESPFEEWVAENNGHADSLATRANEERSQAFRELLALQRHWDKRHTTLMANLRSYYFAIFERNKENKVPRVCVLVDSSDEDSEGAVYSFLDVLSAEIDPQHFVQFLGFPVAFLQTLVDWIKSHEQDDAALVSVSFLEITFGLLKIDPIHFPFRNSTDGTWTMMDRRSRFERPTLTHYFGAVQKVFRYLIRHWCDLPVQCKGLNRSHLGVTTPLDGIRLRMAPSVLASVHESLAIFTSTRPIRRTGDMARPVV